MNRKHLPALVTAVGFVTALLVRVLPGGLKGAVDYDEGVYVAAALALLDGRFPWRDFAFVHPPGVILWLVPAALAGPKAALLIGRVLAALVGALNTVMLGRLVRGWAGVAAAVFLGLWWETVLTDRGVYLEPLMNAAGLGALLLLHDAPSRKRVVAAGVLCALAVGFKLLGGLWCVIAFITCPRELRARLVASAVVTFAVLFLPFVALAPSEAFFELITVHSVRPPDGDLELLIRLREMFVARSLDATILMVLLLPFAVTGARRWLGRGVLLGLTLMVGLFLSMAAFWNQYDAALAPLIALLLGLGLAGLVERLGQGQGEGPTRARTFGAGWIPAALVLGLGLRHWSLAIEPPPAAPPPLTLQPGTCAIENYVLVQADQRPALVSPMLIDSYGQVLVDVARSGKRFRSIDEAFADDVSQQTLLRQLPQCEFLQVGNRANQFSPTSRAFIAEHFTDLGNGSLKRR